MTVIKDSVDELVEEVTYYKPRPLLLHTYIAPFVPIYSFLIYLWLAKYSYSDSQELWLISVLVFLTIQILSYLFCHWSVDVNCFLAYWRVYDPFQASFAKVKPTPNNGSTELVEIHSSSGDGDVPTFLWFRFQKTKYLYNQISGKFEVLKFPVDLNISQYIECKGYLNEQQLITAQKKYDKNDLEMVVPEFRELFKERATAPFFVFQVFCVALWCLDEFWYYSLFTLFMLIAFECILIQQQLRNLSEVRNMGNKPYHIQVYRNQKWRSLMTNELIPGDIVSVNRSQNENLVPCDLLLLRGSCIVDESMLTGESVLQMKEPVEHVERLDEPLDMDRDGRLHVLYGGTKIAQHTPPPKTVHGIRASDNGCVAYVLRTSFNTSQGKLLRTILFGVKRVTANNLETFFFILFLLVFAIAAAIYVWIVGVKDPNRNRYKLFLECTLIMTSVVPPELPIELSLAVNTSLVWLSKLYIYCTEPFRIPFAGKVQICCFDKTGTLTSDNLVVEGVAGIKGEDKIIPISEAPMETIQVVGACHSLVQLDDGLVGDPLEKTSLAAIDWNLTKGESVMPRKGKGIGLKILHRFHFSSALKRMSVIASYTPLGSNETIHLGLTKGAPEILKKMFFRVPPNYDDIYIKISRRGSRVLALGRKELGSLSHNQVREMNRESLEKNLEFVGFIVVSCPLKPDSKAVIREVLNSSHNVMMITGDAPLTACHVAKELDFCKRDDILILSCDGNCDDDSSWSWNSIYEEYVSGLLPQNPCKFFLQYDLCVTGDGINHLLQNEPKFFRQLLPHIRVFARVAPKQKEYIITALKSLGFCTLMCGDGTNDVGALKHAHVGVALLTSYSTPSESSKSAKKKESPVLNTNDLKFSKNFRNKIHKKPFETSHNMNSRIQSRQEKVHEAHKHIQKMLQEMDDQEKVPIVKLGDASIAAPFTSRLSSIQCVCHIIKQGRCTLVTTLQMFKILALNALIIAYSQSVLYSDGIKFSDGQATLQGSLLAICFLFISRSKPLKVLSKTRPLPNIFNAYTISTVLLQFGVHFASLIYLVREANARSPKDESLNLGSEFKPSLLNSTVYLISVALQVSTLAVNYKGHPFMESLSENKPLMWSILGSIAGVIVLVCGFIPDLANQFSIVEFPSEFQMIILGVIGLDLVIAFLIDRICEFLFGYDKIQDL